MSVLKLTVSHLHRLSGSFRGISYLVYSSCVWVLQSGVSSPSSVILLSMRRKLVSLQLVCVSAVTKWWTPSSVIGLKWTVKLLSWSCSLPQNNFASSIHPSDWRLLAHKSKSKIPSTDFKSCQQWRQTVFENTPTEIYRWFFSSTLWRHFPPEDVALPLPDGLGGL